MAGSNPITGNVLVIDSLGKAGFPGGGDAHVLNIAFYGVDSTSRMELTMYPATSTVVVMMQSPVNQPNLTQLKFGEPVHFWNFRVKTLTSGTGFVYFS